MGLFLVEIFRFCLAKWSLIDRQLLDGMILKRMPQIL